MMAADSRDGVLARGYQLHFIPHGGTIFHSGVAINSLDFQSLPSSTCRLY